MSLLDACAQADLSDAALSVMGDTASVERASRVRDASGGYSDTYAVVGTTPILLYRPAGQEDTTVAGIQSEQTVQMEAKVPVGSGVLQRDRLTVRGQHFQVLVVQPVPTFAAAQRLTLAVIL